MTPPTFPGYILYHSRYNSDVNIKMCFCGLFKYVQNLLEHLYTQPVDHGGEGDVKLTKGLEITCIRQKKIE